MGYSPIGLHRAVDLPIYEEDKEKAASSAKIWNVVEVMSYIPIVAIIAAVVHIIIAIGAMVNRGRESISFSAVELGKATLLIVTLGFAGPFYAIYSLHVSQKRERDRYPDAPTAPPAD